MNKGLMVALAMLSSIAPRNSFADAQPRSWSSRTLSQAEDFMGHLYSEGKWVNKNEAVSMRWYKRAAALGNADAEYWVGIKYLDGVGVLSRKVSSEGLALLRSAARQGNEPARKIVNKLDNEEKEEEERRQQAADAYESLIEQASRFPAFWASQIINNDGSPDLKVCKYALEFVSVHDRVLQSRGQSAWEDIGRKTMKRISQGMYSFFKQQVTQGLINNGYSPSGNSSFVRGAYQDAFGQASMSVQQLPRWDWLLDEAKKMKNASGCKISGWE